MTFDPNTPWYRLPRLVAMGRLIEIRNQLRQENLVDTEEPPLAEHSGPLPAGVKEARTVDGSFNDLKCPMMGSTGRRFGRNVPLSAVSPDTAHLLDPNPRTVSRELLTRDRFRPATILNLMAASWIQFQVHDWFVHREGVWTDTHDIPLEPGDQWHENPMRVPKTPPDPAPSGSTRPPAYTNQNSHWWDGSQIYGSTQAVQSAVRTGADGKVRVEPGGRLPVDPATGKEITGFTENSWVGISMLHGLFALEHNVICDKLRGAFPAWTDEQLFQRARLINAALMAKIHTVEWTPAILPHELIQLAMRTNWWGVLGDAQKLFPGLNDNELLGGIIGSPTDHHTAPYSLTEEFAAVYRMHPLMPDEFTFRSAATGQPLGTFQLPDVSGRRGLQVLDQIALADLFYSFGTSHPGALRLHNYPKHLQHLVKDNGERFDLGAVDVLRDRERGVPRYNAFRQFVHKPPVRSFEELTDDPIWAVELKRVYGHDIEKVDLMVGLMAEPLPEGFGFSDTAFRIFVLMASRRLKSDRFFTADYRPEIYTQIGIDWVEHTTMKDVLLRHFPVLGTALRGVENAFHPWRAR
jgi:hypothetical protein